VIDPSKTVDATSANIGVSKDEFVSNLTLSKLLGEEELQQILESDPQADALGLAHLLLSKGLLTDFQLDLISQGRPKEVRIGNYDILNRLGAGGMGTVFKARHRRMKRIVALKVLSANLCKDRSFVQRFQQEVETIARLGHPNVVMAYDADEDDVGHFLVMEFVDGQDLTSFTEQNHPLPVSVALDCVLQAARGLAYAHSRGVIHRDIKPANLLRDKSGVVKVTDLGLARLNSNDADSSAANGLTQAGGVLGTVDYMAPEQAVDSTTIDYRADIYSLGATLHFLLMGRPPYTGKSVMSVLVKHRESPIPVLSEIRSDVSPDLETIFNKMMAKSLSDRYGSMPEVVSDLEAAVLNLTGSAPTSPVQAPPITGVKSGSSVSLGRADVNTIITAPMALVSVLIVEPSRAQAGIIRRYLEANDVAVSSILTSAETVIEFVKANRPDAILSAFHLSDMTGVELAKLVQSENQSGRPPGFVLISSESDADETHTMSRLDRVVVLAKPFTPEQLIQALNLVTGKSIALKSNATTMTGVSTIRPGISQVIPKPKIDRANLRVLIVDDSSAARVHEKSILQSLGFSQFIEAADGAQAIAAATREPFDLIVSDYNMPLMDGYALVSYLKQTKSTASIPIVMVTTETSPDILDPVRKLGVIEILAKNFPVDAVKKLMDQLFR
jgi:serine/threonine protein kinase/DNA-binding response OmpR family regulator